MTLLHEENSQVSNAEPEPERVGRLPDFLIIGAMKSGTTTLFELLGRHPKIFVPYWKELQFFSRDSKFCQGENYYRAEFINAADDQIIGEASTCYSRWPHYPHAAERIAKILPDVRLIYVMRHPVERAYSHYGHIMQERMIRKDGPFLTFEEALATEKEIIDASMYMMQIERYLSLFRRDQFLFLTFDELKRSPDALLERTQRFLGITPMNLTAAGQVKANQWGDKVTETRINTFVQRFKRILGLSKIIRIIPHDTRKRLKENVIHSSFLNSIFKLGLKGQRKLLSPLTQTTRETLLRQFEEPTRQLENFLALELPTWHR